MNTGIGRAATALLVASLALLVPLGGAQAASGNGPSGNAIVSLDGRFVAVASEASDLVAGDTNGVSDAFVRDRERRITQRVSVGPAGVQANARTGASAISADGRVVVMWSDASNLVPGDTNGFPDIFVRDRLANTTERVSVATGGTQATGESAQAVASADGRIVAFASTASNLAGAPTPGFTVFVRDRGTATTELIGAGWMPALSADGRYVAFASREGRILVHDRALTTTDNVSGGLPGVGSVPTISADGRFVAFLMEERIGVKDRRVALYVRDRARQTTERVIEGVGAPSISADGRFVAFWNQGVFVRELATGATEQVADGNGYGGSGPLSGDGRFVAFFSLASDLAPADRNGAFDVFVRDRRAGTTELVSVARSWVLVAQRLTLLPKRPAPGRVFAATLRVAGGDGAPISAATVHCAVRIGGHALRTVTAILQSSTVRCAWRIPVRAHLARLSGSISVSTPQDSLRRTFVTRVR